MAQNTKDKRTKAILAKVSALASKLTGKKRQAAEFIFNHPHQVAFISLRKLASESRVSTSVISNLVTDLGFDSYDAFKAEFQLAVTGEFNYFAEAAMSSSRSRSSDRSIARQIVENDVANIQATLELTRGFDWRGAAKAIYQARMLFVVGMRVVAPVASYLAYQLSFIRNDVRLIEGGRQMLADQIAQMQAADVIIATSFFPYSSDTCTTVAYAKKIGARVVALTDRSDSPIASDAAYTLLFSTSSPFIYNSITSCFVLAQAITAEVLSIAGAEGLARVRERERLLKSFHVFKR
jgi:DNA-binding MurR/RpiR family transcriptional regulator